MKIKAIIFDFDGTLVDSESMHYESWRAFLKEGYGVDFQEEDYFENFAGIPGTYIADEIKKRYNIAQSIHELTEQKQALALARAVTADITFMPFARQMMEDLRNRKIPFSIVTGSSRNEMEPVLQRAGILDYFQYTITSDDVTKSKPSPEGYRNCATLMGFDPSEYLVFEDTFTGVTAAKGAQLTCFGVQKAISYHPKLQNVGVDRIFSNLEEAAAYLEENHWELPAKQKQA